MKKILIIILLFFNLANANDDPFVEYLKGKHKSVKSDIPNDPYLDLRSVKDVSFPDFAWKPPMFATYFVATNGNSSNTGATSASPWNFAHAITQATAGDIVNVLAGDYGNIALSFPNSGTEANPIRFIGYQTNPNDITPEANSTIKNTADVSPSRMPLLIRTWLTNTFAITITGDYNHISNIQVQGYEIAFMVQASAEYNILDNIIAKEQGNTSISTNDTGHVDRYKGEGVRLNGNNNIIRNFAMYNPTQQGIGIVNGDYNYIHDGNMEAYISNNSTDYFCLTSGNASYNIVDNVILNRSVGNLHNGHGFVGKGNGVEYNIYRNSEVLHTSVCEVNGQGVRNNLFQNIKSSGTYAQFQAGTGGDQYGFIYIFNGANNNYFDKIWVDNAWHFVMFFDNGESLSSNVLNREADGGIARNAGNNNRFTNCIGTRNGNGVYINETNGASSAYANSFINCSFVNIVDFFIQARSANTDFLFQNILIHNAPSTVQQTGGYLLTNPTMSHINKSGSGFSASDLSTWGNNLTSITPSFLDISTFDLRMENSNLDIGTSITDPNLIINSVSYPTLGMSYNGVSRSSPVTIGANEFSGTLTSGFTSSFLTFFVE